MTGPNRFAAFFLTWVAITFALVVVEERACTTRACANAVENLGILVFFAMLAGGVFGRAMMPRRLAERQQRVLFVVGVALALPWLVARVIMGAFSDGSADEYLHHLFAVPFGLVRWDPPRWHDMLLWGAVAALVCAFWWHLTVVPASRLTGRLAAWVDRG